MSNKSKKRKGEVKKQKGCENCANCLAIGKGDHVCDAYDTPFIVIEEYIPSTRYLRCDGRKWVSN